MTKFWDRVTAEANSGRPLALFLTIIAAPFYAFGWFLGLVVVVAVTVYGAVKLGIKDARARAAAKTLDVET